MIETRKWQKKITNILRTLKFVVLPVNACTIVKSVKLGFSMIKSASKYYRQQIIFNESLPPLAAYAQKTAFPAVAPSAGSLSGP